MCIILKLFIKKGYEKKWLLWICVFNISIQLMLICSYFYFFQNNCQCICKMCVYLQWMNVYMCIYYKKILLNLNLKLICFVEEFVGKQCFFCFVYLYVCLLKENIIFKKNLLNIVLGNFDIIDRISYIWKKNFQIYIDFYLYFIEKDCEKVNFQFNLVNICKIQLYFMNMYISFY